MHRIINGRNSTGGEAGLKQTFYYTLLGLGLLCLLAAMVEFSSLRRIHKQNQIIQTLLSGQAVPLYERLTPPQEIRLARVIYLHGKQRYDDALAEIDLILDQGDAHFQAKTRYNLGNLYLDQAIEQVRVFKMDQALPLAQLAKDAYRAALAQNSQYWAAKYNLEVAMRLLPEMGRLQATDAGETEQKDQLWTSVPGFPRGLP